MDQSQIKVNLNAGIYDTVDPDRLPDLKLKSQGFLEVKIYRQFMAREQDEDLVRVLDRKNPPSMRGSEKFTSWIKDRFFKKKIDKEVPASNRNANLSINSSAMEPVPHIYSRSFTIYLLAFAATQLSL